MLGKLAPWMLDPEKASAVEATATGWVYFITCEELNAVKIGLTLGDPEQRLRTLQTGSVYKLELLGLIPCASSSEARRLEQELHYLFLPLRIRAEWFRQDGRLLDLLCVGGVT